MLAGHDHPDPPEAPSRTDDSNVRDFDKLVLDYIDAGGVYVLAAYRDLVLSSDSAQAA